MVIPFKFRLCAQVTLCALCRFIILCIQIVLLHHNNNNNSNSNNNNNNHHHHHHHHYYNRPRLIYGRSGGLTVSALVFEASGLGSSPGRGHCVVFLCKTLYSHSASFHPGVQMGTGEFIAGG